MNPPTARPAQPPRPASASPDSIGVARRLVQTTAFWMFVSLLLLVAVFGLLSPRHVFFNVSNLFTIALNAAELMLIAVGMAYLLGAGQLDLSVGSNLTLSSVLAAKTIV